MACFKPLQGYRDASGCLTFSARRGADVEVTVPCGSCIGCRVARARAWTLRLVHESSLWEFSQFATLTYDDERLPEGGSLRYRDVQLFLKRLRRQFPKQPLRFFCVGEYGEQLLRPHYHVCLFNVRFPDQERVSYLGESRAMRSPMLERLWSHGHVQIDELNLQTAAYAARYCLKKVTGDAATSYYRRVDPEGVVHSLVPEFCRMSLRPGIGAGWLDKFSSDVYPHDFVVADGRTFPVPKYYDRLTERSFPDLIASVREDRELKAIPFRPEQLPGRVEAREEVARARVSQYQRSYER